MNHVEMMRSAELVAADSECPDRQVGAVLRIAKGGIFYASNLPAWDDTNNHHAEAMILNDVDGMGLDVVGATLYTTCRPCARCTAMLVGRGIKAIYYRDKQPEMAHLQALVRDGVYLNSNWIAGQQPIELSPVQKGWADRWQE